MRRIDMAILCMTILVGCHASWGTPAGSEEEQVKKTLDNWYEAARKEDPRYFDFFSNDNAIFLGTDPDERWTPSAFQDKYKKPSWDYTAKERHVFFSSDRTVAWFDELLERKPDFGEMRATGVLIRSKGAWKIAQYNLAFLVPNSIFPDLRKGESCLPRWAMRCERPQEAGK
jgi:hypothetical protein